MNTSIIDQVVEQLKVMPQQKQWQVLEFIDTKSGSHILTMIVT